MIPEPCLATSKLCDNMDHVLQCMIIVLFFFQKYIYTVVKSATKSEKNQDILLK